ncbi:hypothetical protein Taro_007392, partial [Colocasia esculenta]|nr:hypothetical protein [Colocasia esculenta]
VTSREGSLSENADRSEQLPTINSVADLGYPSFSLTDTRSQENMNDKGSVLPPASDGWSIASVAFAATPDPSEHLQALCLSNEAELSHVDQLYCLEKEIPDEVKPVDSKNETVNQMKGPGSEQSHFPSCTDLGNQINRGKNPYALSVLRLVEMKLDGREVKDKSYEMSEIKVVAIWR